MAGRAHVVDRDAGRRARVSRELDSYFLRIAIYEGLYEFLDAAPTEGLVFAAADSDAQGQPLDEIMRTTGIDLPIIGYAEDLVLEDVVEAMAAGAAGFLQWPFGCRQLSNTLRRISGEGAQRLKRQRAFSQARAQVGILSPRERQVLTLLVAGLTNKQIAQALEISFRTVEIHRSHMMLKLGARSAAHAVKIGLYAGLDDDLTERHLDEVA